jgi:hypothetical protein
VHEAIPGQGRPKLLHTMPHAILICSANQRLCSEQSFFSSLAFVHASCVQSRGLPSDFASVALQYLPQDEEETLAAIEERLEVRILAIA